MDELKQGALARAGGDVLPPGHVFAGLPSAHFATIVSDPPWKFQTRSEKGLGRSPDRHYRTMTVEEICALPVADLAAPDCFLFLWITGPMLAAGEHSRVLRAWGFKASSLAFVWLKTTDPSTVARAQSWDEIFTKGTSFTTLQNAEVVILGRRGSPRRLDKTIRQIVIAPRRAHSEKPAEVIRRIERFSEAPRLEMFARHTRPGWHAFGDQVGLLDSVA